MQFEMIGNGNPSICHLYHSDYQGNCYLPVFSQRLKLGYFTKSWWVSRKSCKMMMVQFMFMSWSSLLYIESKVLSGMIYHSIEYRVIPSAFNTQERIQNCKRLVMMHISWVNHKYMEEKIGWDRLWYPTTFLPIPTPITFYKHQILNLWTDWPPLWTYLVFVNNYWAWGDYMIICRS